MDTTNTPVLELLQQLPKHQFIVFSFHISFRDQGLCSIGQKWCLKSFCPCGKISFFVFFSVFFMNLNEFCFVENLSISEEVKNLEWTIFTAKDEKLICNLVVKCQLYVIAMFLTEKSSLISNLSSTWQLLDCCRAIQLEPNRAIDTKTLCVFSSESVKKMSKAVKHLSKRL